MQTQLIDSSQRQPSRIEKIKEANPTLAGNIAITLGNSVAENFSAEDCDLLKFHGIHQVMNRDRRHIAKEFRFQVITRMPGGIISAEHYLAFDQLATQFGNDNLRITSRQALRFQGVAKPVLARLMKGIHEIPATTLATGGDIARNIMAPVSPAGGPLVELVQADARRVSDALLPCTPAYREIWASHECPANDAGQDFEDPLYGQTYLPRKFKTAFAIPPLNDVDIFTHCLGFVAIANGNDLAGYNLLAGGGLGTSFGSAETYPRLADVVGFLPREQVVEAARAVVALYRDFGDRTNRSHARLKYLVQEKGLEWFCGELEARLGFKLQPAKPFRFTAQEDDLGWHKQYDGNFFLGLHVEHGCIRDTRQQRLKTALRVVTEQFKREIRLTPSQNVLLINVPDENRAAIERVFVENGIDPEQQPKGIRHAAMTCAALPLCGRALAEAERFFPKLLDQIEQLMAATGLNEEKIIIRMNGCPNGCDRSRTAEIGIIGKAPNKYHLYLGGNRMGTRLNVLFKESVSADSVADELRLVLVRYAQERKMGESFGDFCHRMASICQ